MPVSTIATSASTRWSIPLIRAAVERRVPILDTPVGMVWLAISTSSSGTTSATSGSAFREATCSGLSLPANPLMTLLKERSACVPSSRAWRSRTVLSVAFFFRTTM